ncbi:MAG: FapA family protein [Spirochaetaceae bacterium]|jgi:uncharacterized protein (DUF342 family)|nr:FapA family protein [Spirochaetaceae bacterium]
MIDFIELKNRLQPRLEADLFVQSVETEGISLEGAVLEAATLLGLPVRRIEYEIVERGFAGLFGKGVKPWKIKAYARLAEIDKPDDSEEYDTTLEDAPELEVAKIDGQVFVQFRNGDVLLKVTPPIGKGKSVTEAEARGALERRRIMGYNDTQVRQVVKEAADTYIRVAAFQHNAANDSFARVEVSEDEMNAYVSVTPPGAGGGDISSESLKRLLHGNGVIYGIKEDFLVQFTDRPTYGTRVCVAEGKLAINGMDAYMDYFFEVGSSIAPLRENTMGAVNFKELNTVQNVMSGDKLARKMPPEKGKHGRTVTGKLLPATDGQDIPLPLGENVKVDKDGLTIVATENGKVVLGIGKISVEKVLTIDGSVGVRTGNIIFLGSVVVNGNVEEGYSVKATGNIEVTGLVEKAELDAEGDIIIKQGITGKPGVLVRAGQTIFAKFIENAVVKCGGSVIVSEGLLNSTVSARQRVVCQGKRAAIIGGKICAGEEIQSKVLGSASGNTETICEVGYDPELKENIALLTARQTKTQEDFDDLQRDISTLEKMKERRKELPEDKEAYLAELLERRVDLGAKISRLKDRVEKAKEQLTQVEKNGKVSVSAKCYPGTVIFIRDVRTAIRSEYKCVTFTALNGLIQIGKFVDENAKASERKSRK